MRLRLDGKTWITVHEAATTLGVTERHVRRLRQRGTLTERTIGRDPWVDLATVNSYASQRGPWAPLGIYGGAQTARDQQLRIPHLEDQHE
jgi:excisionase family DNA binding protein